MKSASPCTLARMGFLSALLIITLILPAQTVDAQYCMEYDPPDPFDTSDDCRAMPGNDRTFFPVAREWGGSDFLFHSRGNELEILSLSNPENPIRLSRSSFRVGNVGDADYELYKWGSCDDCRYGYTVHTLAGVFFDLGVTSTPTFVDYEKFYDYPDLAGGMTFKHEGTQYLIQNQIGNGVCGNTSGLFIFDGVDADALPYLECVTKANDQVFQVSGGIYLQDNRYNNGDAYLWLSDTSQIFIYKIVKPGGPSTLTLQLINMLDFGNYSGGAIGGFAVDYDRGLAVTTSYAHGLKVWELSDLSNPQLRATRSDVLANWLTLGDGLVIAGAYGDNSPLYSFDLSVLSNPTPLDQPYWDFSNSWNDLPCWGGNLGAAFTKEGDYLFISRWEMMQRHKFQNCGGPQAPTARATMGRWNGFTCGALLGDVFPGDEICAKTDSSGDILSTDIWITDASGATVGSTSGGATAGPLPYTVPVGGDAGQPSTRYTAHVRAANDVGETEDTDFTLVDLTPQATISFLPIAPLTGETLNLSADAEGEPGVPDGGNEPDPFEWTITPPIGEPYVLYGADPTEVDLADAGLYQFDLRVLYRHGAAAPYIATNSLDLQISSVSAAFVVTPSNPVNTADVVLNGTQSRWSIGASPQWTWEYREVGSSYQQLSACTSQICTIPGSDLNQFFSPGTYDFRLTLSIDPDVSSVEVEDVDIADGTVNLDFEWSPNNPAIGQDANFHVTGTTTVESATWNFGGGSCDGAIPQVWTCTAGVIDCLSVPYAYSSGGTKNVTMSAVIDGQTFGPVSHQVSVLSSGTCGGGGGGGGGTPTCTYVVSPTSRTVPATGGTGLTISVSTQTGCAWSVNESAGWINVTSGSSGTGTGVVSYNVAANAGGSRSAVISAAGKSHTVFQDEPIPVDFTWTPNTPDIGEEVLFSVTDSRVTPIRWEFGGSNCDGSSAVLDCSAAPSACRDIPWEYTQGGWKTVRLVAQEGEKTRGVQVLDQGGECCFKDGPPIADFTMTPNPVFTRDDVIFADASAKSTELDSAKTTALGFTWNPIQPNIGDSVSFTITGVGAVSSAEWDMGGPGCGDYEQFTSCTPLGLIDCMSWTHKYASGGPKTVKLTINGGSSQVTETVTIANDGSCSGGGGGGCSYVITPSSRTFDQNGGSGTITVSTGSSCEWTATESSQWLTITGGSSGTGPGTVSYSVDSNTGAFRTAAIAAAGKTHTVRQDAYQGPQDIEPTSWDWTVSLGGTTIVTSDQPTFTYSFEEPGLYDVRYEVSNCEGNDVEFGQLLVEQAPVVIPEAYLVPSAVHAPGLNNTSWRTDLRIFNPDVTSVQMDIEYQPENTNNSAAVGHGILIEVPPGGTRAYDDILNVIPGIIVDEDGSFSGSLNITYNNGGDEEVPPLIVSRTYNEAEVGTYGQFVPAVPVLPADDNRLFLTGLVHNLYYRTNIRLANMSDESVTAVITLVDEYGDTIGDPIYPTVQPQSTTQINAVAEAAGIVSTVDIFSVQVDTGSPEVWAWASVVDNANGDPVLFSSFITDEDDARLWVPGLARLSGANESQWRSDITFFNRMNENLSVDVRYVPSEDLGIQPYLKIRGLQPGNALYYVDILGVSMLPTGVESKGYFVIEPFEDSVLPQVAARTYNLDVSGGTFGQNVFVFRARDLILEGFVGWIPGVAMSATDDDGFRSNLGLLNTDEANWAEVRLVVLNEEGVVTGDVVDLWLEPGQFKQFNLADRLNVPAIDMNASVEVEVLSGGPVGAYASTVDNRTQDPILIPAVPDIQQFMK